MSLFTAIRAEIGNWKRRRQERLVLRWRLKHMSWGRTFNHSTAHAVASWFHEDFPDLDEHEILHEIELEYFKRHA